MSLSPTQLAFFALGTVQRSCHNYLIGMSKVLDEATGKLVFAYKPITMTSTAQCIVALSALFGVFQTLGMEGVKRCFDLKAAMAFSIVGLVYACDDFLEMEANKHMDPATYTVLSQAKLIVTALLTLVILKKNQTHINWMLLILTTAGMAEYVFIDHHIEAKELSGSIIGVTWAFCKVFSSCIGAVFAERAMKSDNSPFLVQLFYIKGSQTIFAYIMAFALEGSWIMQNGFFHGWTFNVLLLLIFGFVAKTTLSVVLVFVLNSIMKNLTEVVSMALVYIMVCFFGGKDFYTIQFIAAVILLLAAYSYIANKSAAPEPKASDKVSGVDNVDASYKLMEEGKHK